MLLQDKAEALLVANGLFSRLLAAAPDEKTWQEFLAIGQMAWVNENASPAELNIFENLQQSLNEDLNDVILDYNQLFIGPSEPKAAPWASLYLSEKKHVFSEETLKVKSFYEKYKMEGVFAHEPADHISLEFRFISLLLSHFLQADEKAKTYILRDLGLFLHHHFFPWAGLCLQNIEQNAQTNFYKNIAILAVFTLEALGAIEFDI